MTTFAARPALPSAASADPTKHVNYTFGMVLGVDDLVQEFAYHNGRSRWIARDLIGYGTVSGLKVSYETTYEGPQRGPRLSVSPGVAVSPAGDLICVKPAQCAYLNDWLRDHRIDVAAPSSPPMPARAWLVLCYRDCPTDDVPVPGEPCRSEDDLLAPSRLKDDFLLELRLDPPTAPPDHSEEAAVRRFVSWLRQVPTAATGSSLAEFADAIRAGAGLSASASSPPSPPTPPGFDGCPSLADFMKDPPPPALAIPSGQVTEYLREAFRVWVTELLPCWRMLVPGCGCECGDPAVEAADPHCLVLAEVDIPFLLDVVEDRLLVGPGPVAILEETRPYLVDSRMLQEWMLGEAGEAPSAAPAPAGPQIVAAGRFDMEGKPSPAPMFSFGTLAAVPRVGSPGVYDLSFDELLGHPKGMFVITGSVISKDGSGGSTLDLLVDDPPAVRVLDGGVGAPVGFTLQIVRVGDHP